MTLGVRDRQSTPHLIRGTAELLDAGYLREEQRGAAPSCRRPIEAGGSGTDRHARYANAFEAAPGHQWMQEDKGRTGLRRLFGRGCH